MSEYIIDRIMTPADSTGKRYSIHPVTTSDAVIVDTTTGKTLEEFITNLNGSFIASPSETQPDSVGFWAKLKYEDSDDL